MSANENSAHESLIKTPQQLIIVMVLAFVVPVVLMLLLVQLVLSGTKTDDAQMSREAVEARIKPVAEVRTADTEIPAASTVAGARVAAAAPRGKPDGKKIYDTTCVACHSTGVANAPKFGDKAAWSPRLAHGIASLYQSALKGKNAMPPKGGNASLSDADIKAAVDYIAGASK